MLVGAETIELADPPKAAAKRPNWFFVDPLARRHIPMLTAHPGPASPVNGYKRTQTSDSETHSSCLVHVIFVGVQTRILATRQLELLQSGSVAGILFPRSPDETRL